MHKNTIRLVIESKLETTWIKFTRAFFSTFHLLQFLIKTILVFINKSAKTGKNYSEKNLVEEAKSKLKKS